MNSKAPNSAVLNSRLAPIIAAMLLAGALVSGPVDRVEAALTTGAGDEHSFTIGAFQLNVDPAFAFLFAPHAPSIYYYPGYSPTSGVLTSPMMYDFTDTIIGVSANHVRSLTPSTYFPVTVGTPSTPYPLYFPHSIPNYGSYVVIPPGFTTASQLGKDEICTEIESFNLQTAVNDSTGGLQCTNSRDPRVPTMTTNVSVVVAGGLIPGLPLNRRSIGMVQEVGTGDFFPNPAQSFFDIYVEVDLPISAGDNTAYDFPPFSGNLNPTGQIGAVLYNDANDPLVITNLDITFLPPYAIYDHATSTAVPMKFRYANPPYWAADDVIGYLTLAGHGSMGSSSPSNCAAIASATGTFLDHVLGPVGSPRPQMPIPWLRSSGEFPSTNSGYGSVQNTVTDGTGTSVLDDTATFAVPGLGTCYVRDLVLKGLDNSISPPSPAGTSATYSAANTALSFQFSSNGVNYYDETPTGPGTLAVTITNNGPIGSLTSYGMEMLSMNNSDSSFFGPVFIRESPTKQSLGRHTIQPDPRGYRVSSFFDVFTEISFNGTDWFPANNSIRLQAIMPPAAPGSIFITNTGTQVVLNWQNNFPLQSATDVSGPYTDVVSVSGPVIAGPYYPDVGSSQMFFRLRQSVGFYQLQVLLPGETAAPGTTTGKIGTPTPQTADQPFSVVVNAVDANWNLVSSSDQVLLTSTDGTAILPSPADLVNGSTVLSVAFGSSGKFTVTGSDVTDSSKKSNTSTSVLSQ